MGKGGSQSQTDSNTTTNTVTQDLSFTNADYSSGDGPRLTINMADGKMGPVNITDAGAVKGSLDLVSKAVGEVMTQNGKALGVVERSTIQALNAGKYSTDKALGLGSDALGAVERSNIQSLNASKYVADKAFSAINSNTQTAFDFVRDATDKGETEFKDLVVILGVATVGAIGVYQGIKAYQAAQ